MKKETNKSQAAAVCFCAEAGQFFAARNARRAKWRAFWKITGEVVLNLCMIAVGSAAVVVLCVGLVGGWRANDFIDEKLPQWKEEQQKEIHSLKFDQSMSEARENLTWDNLAVLSNQVAVLEARVNPQAIPTNHGWAISLTNLPVGWTNLVWSERRYR